MKKIIAAAIAVLMLCSCESGSETKEFAKYREAAESKSGVVYKTTYFVANDEEEGYPYPSFKDGKYAFVYKNSDGKIVELTDYVLEDAHGSYVVSETQFLAPAKYDGKWGYLLLDNTAENDGVLSWDIEPQYENAERFTEQFAAVMKDGKYGMINENGEIVIPFEYDSIKYRSFTYFPASENGEWYFINGSNEKVFGPFEDAESYEYGFAAVKKDGKWGFIDKNGLDATAYVYDEAYSVEDDGCAWVRIGEKWEKELVRR